MYTPLGNAVQLGVSHARKGKNETNRSTCCYLFIFTVTRGAIFLERLSRQRQKLTVKTHSLPCDVHGRRARPTAMLDKHATFEFWYLYIKVFGRVCIICMRSVAYCSCTGCLQI